MLSRIRGIRINGALYSTETTINLFSDNESDRVSLIFGRNGSGKSTVSRAVAKATCDDESDIVSAQFVGYDGMNLVLTEDVARRVHVFNEDYISSKVRFREDGLGTIVMFGETGDIADQIEAVEQEIKEVEKNNTSLSEQLKEFNDDKNMLSPKYHYTQVKTSLQGDASWAGRERLIVGSKQNASVMDATINNIMDEIPIESQDEVINAYDKAYNELLTVKEHSEKITSSLPSMTDYTDSLIEVVKLLGQRVEQPSLNERERKLLAIALDGRQETLYDMRRDFSDDSTDTCPYCLQSVADEYKHELIKSIEKVLSEDVENHRDELTKSKIQTLSMDFSAFDIADKGLTDKCRNALSETNAEISNCNIKIEEKIGNLFNPITDFSSELQAKAEFLCGLISELEETVEHFNSQIAGSADIQDTLKRLNKKRAYHEVKSHYANYLKQSEEKECCEKSFGSSQTELLATKNKLEELNEQKRNVRIALDFINNGLQYVFFSADRLTVDYNGENYIILSNGNPVRPRNISAGERNILALCYFMTDILSDTDEKDTHKTEYMIVIDDPVSSFDLENRVGVISFLKSQMIKILRGNPNSRVVLLSHDLLAIYDIEKALEEIKEQISVKLTDSSEKNMTYRLFELDSKSIRDFRHNDRNEYSLSLKIIYGYAVGKSSEYELVIGNIMRRALEAFSNFEYRKGISEISCDPAVLASLGDDEREYFENLMYRLVLNGESHLRERATLLADNNFFATISKEEKKRTARDILCLIYLLNKKHITAHITAMKDEISADAISNIEDWVKKIPAQKPLLSPRAH